jgi:hypothetical protein
MLDRATILAVSRTLPSEPVAVPEWGGTVFVRVMTAGERDRFEVIAEDTARKDFRALLAVFTVCDDAGTRLFTEADVPDLTRLPFQGLQRIAEAAMKLNQVTTEGVNGFKKNSEPIPSGDSS